MPVNLALGHVSNDFLIVALVIYSLSVVAFAGDFAFGRPRRADTSGGVPQERAAALATVGAAGAVGAVGGAEPTSAAGSAGVRGPGGVQAPPGVPARAGFPASAGDQDAPGAGGGSGRADSMPELAVPALRAIREAGPWVRAGVALSSVGVVAHTVAVITRGLAVHRAPWGNMYEFVTALTCVAAIFFLFVMIRYRAWSLGVFVMGAVVVALGLAETLIYTAAGQLVPALQSYWLDIHVTAMTLATGIFFVAAVLGTVYLIVDRYTRRVAAGRAEPGNGIIRRLPTIEQLDRLTYRTIVFGFPVWTFGVIAGAIWADQAWGRYWGWDPVETWAFITWVLYAAFLHARATAGWRGRRAHYIQLLGFTSLMFNILVVQVFITGLHSYAGVS
jgi:cytochrome c-type biogenesis protein CcsB